MSRPADIKNQPDTIMALSTHNPFNRFASWRLWLRGWRDGLAAIPAWPAQQQPPVLEELRDAGAHDAALTAERWKERDDATHSAWADRFLERIHAGASVLRAKNEYEAARTTYADANGEDAPATADRRTVVYSRMLIVLGLVEFPINAAAFQALGDNQIATSALALLGGFGLLAAAHFAGEKLRQTHRWTWQTITLTLACVLGPAAVIAGIGYFRSVATDLHKDQLLGLGIELDPTAVTLTYAAFNALAFIVGVAFSYWAHPKGKAELRRTRQRLATARQRLDMADRQLEEARVARAEDREAACAHVDYLQEAVRLRAERYRQANLLARRDRDEHESPYPASFSERLAIERPPALNTLDWSLPTETITAAERLNAALEDRDAAQQAALTTGDGASDADAPSVRIPESLP